MFERKQGKTHIQREVFQAIQSCTDPFTVQDAYLLVRKSTKLIKKAQVRRSLASLSDYYAVLERVSRGIYKIRKKPLDMA